MAAKFSKGQRVNLISVLDEQECEKYPEYDQYVGRIGIVIDIDNVQIGLIVGYEVGTPQSNYIYKLEIDGTEISGIHEECLVEVE